jgi:hypothetical protein
MLYPASAEQQVIIDTIKDKNIIVNAVAGSGKTTTCLHIAKAYADWNILLLTYNAKLKAETRERIKLQGLTNITAHNYHAFCLANYVSACHNETHLKQALLCEPRKPFYYDLIIVDESQDMTEIYCSLVKKILNYKGNYIDIEIPRLLLLGDVRQAIYDFMGADSRYLTLADKIYTGREFVRLSLSVSYRLTPPMCDFMNKCVLGKQVMTSGKTGNFHKPRYIMQDTYDSVRILNVIVDLLTEYEPEDIFILAYSIRQNGSFQSPVVKLEHLIKRDSRTKNVPVFAPVSDEERLKDEVMCGKLTFSTFHQAKGLERKVVIIMGADDSQYKYYMRDEKSRECPNILYVAMTRAIERLILFHDIKNDYLRFINHAELANYCEYEGAKCSNIPTKAQPIQEISVSTLLRHQREDTIMKCYALLTTNIIREAEPLISIPDIIKSRGLFEGVAEITGTAIPIAYEIRILGKCSYIAQHMKKLNMTDMVNLTSAQIAEISTHYMANNNYIFKTKQIESFDWIDEENLVACVENMKSLNLGVGEFEHKMHNKTGKSLCGIADFISLDSIYEFKCVKQLTEVHHLQLALYMFMLPNVAIIGTLVRTIKNGVEYEGEIVKFTKLGATIKCAKKSVFIGKEYTVIESARRAYLYNILSNHLIEVIADYDVLAQIFALLMEKYDEKITFDDEAFLQRIK